MIVRPSVIASTLASLPSSRSSMISLSPAWPKMRRIMIWSMRLERLAEVVADVDALARGQSVGLEDQPQRAAQHEVAGLGGRVEDALLAALFDLDLHARA